jgi:site-specific recombinase XerD
MGEKKHFRRLRAVQEMLGESGSGSPEARKGGPKMSVTQENEFRDYLIDELRFSATTFYQTVRKMRYVLNHTKSDDRSAFQDFIREIWEEGNSNAKANGYIKIINRYLKFKRLPPLKYYREFESFTIKICTQEEKERLLEAAERKGPRAAVMFYLLFGCGTRLAEACDLKIPDIHQDRIYVTGKGQKKREIFLPPETRSRIDSYLKVRAPAYGSDKDYLFTTKAGRKVTYAYFRILCYDVARSAGVKFHPHMARHTYATELLRQGVSVYYVSRLLGHEDLTSTQVYLHPAQSDAIDSVRGVNLFGSDIRHLTGGNHPSGGVNHSGKGGAQAAQLTPTGPYRTNRINLL